MNKENKQTLTIEELIAEVRKHLVSLHYTDETLRHMDNCWKTFMSFAKFENVGYLTTEFGHRFLKEKYNIEPLSHRLTSHKRTMRRAITILSDYQHNGLIYKRQLTKLHVWHDGYHKICEAFMNDIVRDKLSCGSQRQYRHHLEKLTAYFIKNNVLSITDVTLEIIDGYFATYIGYSKRTISYAHYVVKSFFNYAIENDYITSNLSSCIPTIKVDYRSNLPSVFTKDEIQRLLAAVDRNNPQGKRDYAMLLLAVRYGMRVSEIIGLKLNNLDFESKKIKYIQNKTGNPMSVDMLESVGWALIDYLKNSRPQTESPNVFVRLIAPYDAFAYTNNLGTMMQKYLTRAGIKQSNDKHYGMHTIRHSLASHLLEQGNPLHIVSETLGHLELNSTMIYTKIDLPMLELCALEVPNDTK